MSDAPFHSVDPEIPAVAVVGMACRFPGADSVTEFWELLRDGVDPYEAVPDSELRDAGVPVAEKEREGYVAARKRFADPSLFDPEFFGMTPAEAAITDPQQRFLLETAVHALEDAALDARRFDGAIGVYLGMNHSDYLLWHVLAHPEAVERLGWHRVLMGNDRGFTATQLSYRLGLTGPSIAVDCACSSSLAAVHQACQALLNYETDAALAGGSCVRPSDAGYWYSEGGIVSPDGRCRPFSADAGGTVFASGAGLVVLRRLDDALADGDRILAVIRASGLNNDGDRKSTYTAPSSTAQAELISSVHRLAGITADSVSYVEAHGTATPLGDPIEVSALSEAFRASAEGTGFCALGSVKSNIGHLDSASGVAGLIKVVLALRHRALPPSLWCETPSPHIPFDGSPFRVNTRLTPWTGEWPLRAGVSSFGVGGTNVHLLVEEAPPAVAPGGPLPPEAEPDEDGSPVVLPLSAASAASLDVLENALRAGLSGVSRQAVRDMAYTLGRSRTGHRHRKALLWSGDGAVTTLAGGGPDDAGAARPPAFLLSLPEADPRALRSLAARFPALRETVQRLAPGLLADGVPARPPAGLCARLVALGSAAVWADSGVTPAAVLSDEVCRPAAAVLAGGLHEEDVPALFAALARGEQPDVAVRGLRLLPLRIPWYDAAGNELCAAGQQPEAGLFGGRPAAPGRRRLPPRVPALVAPSGLSVAPAAGSGPFSTVPFVSSPEPAGAAPDALSAALAGGWALGLVEELPEPVRATGRVTDLPLYPFLRRRHWLDSRPSVSSGQAADAEKPADDGPSEAAARQIFAEALGISEVAATDSLFALGGDSLLAQLVVAAARRQWGVRVPFGSFLSDPCPGKLAQLAREAVAPSKDRAPEPGSPTGRQPAEGAPSGPRSRQVPLSPAQERFLFLDEFEGAAESYHVPVLAELRGALDLDVLRAALDDVLERHDALRSVYRLVNGRPVREVSDGVTCELPVVDVPDDEALRREVTALLAGRIRLDRPPVLVARVFRMAPDRHVLALVVHHICADARSSGILLRDLYACYAARVGGRPVELPAIDGLAAAHARAEAAWLDSEEAAGHLRFWLDELDGAPPVLELPADRPRGRQRTYAGSKLDFTLPAETSRRVRELAERQGQTPFVVVLSAFVLTLGKICDQRDIVLGVPVSGRHRPELRDLVGNFVNTLPLRSVLDPADGFRGLMLDTGQRLARALDHQDLPFEVVSRHLGPRTDLSVSPVFQVLFNMLSLDAGGADAPAGLEVRPVAFDRTTSPYELSLDWWFDRDGSLSGRVLFDTARLDEETVAGWLGLLRSVLDTVAADPEVRVGSVRPEPPSAARWRTAALTGPSVDVPARPVHSVFAERAAAHPDRPAVTDGRQALSYGELARAGAGLAGLLVSRGVRTGEPVGILVRRGVPLVVALLGVLRAGATPVPLDPALPAQRLALMAEDCGARTIVCLDAADVAFDTEAQPLPVPDLTALRGPEGPLPGDEVDPSVGAYLTYTSGTTGRPKGIHFPHRALTNLVHWETQGFTAAQRWLQLASFGFDAAFHEAFAALCAGGSLHIADDEAKHDHDLLAEFVRTHRVERAILPVSLLHALAARFGSDVSAFRSLREIASTGEQLRISEPVVRFFEELEHCALVNNYGPAETHVVTSYRFCGAPRDWPRYAPIGRPVQNVALTVLGQDGSPAPTGSVGELFIAGPCVATGYFGRPELTEERFGAGPGAARSYRSGDRVRLTRSGDLVYLGRGDQQIKIRGVRVELQEIELALRRVPGVHDVALIVRGEDGDRRIDAYLVADARHGEVAGRARARLREELPAAMVPATFTVVPEFPVNANGKVVPSLLPEPDGAAAGAGTSVSGGAAGTGPVAAGEGSPDLLEQVVAVFRTVLDRPGLGPEDDFFDAGGHSLSATRALHLVRELAGARLSAADFYRLRTASEVTRALREGTPGGAPSDEELPAESDARTLPSGLRGLAGPPAAERQKTFVFALDTPVDLARLQAAVDATVSGHAALRLRCADDGSPALSVAGDSTSPVLLWDALPDGGAEQSAGRMYDAAQAAPIDPRRDPLLRVAVARPAGKGTLLALTVHLLALDGLGLLSLLRSLDTAYREGAPARAEEDRGFLRYLVWRQSLPGTERTAEAAQLWRSLLPADGGVRFRGGGVPGGPGASDAVRQLTWEPAGPLAAAVRDWCARNRTTPFVLHLTAFVSALARSEERHDVCVALPLDGRVHPVLHTSVGAFANVVPFPVPVSDGSSPQECARRVGEVFGRIDALRAVPYADLAAADSRLAAFLHLPTVFNYQRGDDAFRLGGAPLRPVGPLVLPAHQEVQFVVDDGPEGFQVRLTLRGGRDGTSGEPLMAGYREALFALLFDPFVTPGSPVVEGVAGTVEADVPPAAVPASR